MSTGFGEYLVLRRLLTPRAVLQVLKNQARARPHLGELAVHRGWLSWGQVLGVISLGEQLKLRFGEAAVREGLLIDAQVDDLLKEQEAATPTLADCIVELGFIDRHILEREQGNYEQGIQMARSKAASSLGMRD
ncbi:MAG: hypothetical protein FJ293_07310 [Planctomycetes bacterium]|nr:hypothetical protein [Planctomycetota bacterium]